MKRPKFKGFHYDDENMHGWKLGPSPSDGEYHWILDEHQHRCLCRDRFMAKWSLIGTRCLMWHPREVTEDDFAAYNPPMAPEGIEVDP